MRVLVDATPLVGARTGVGVFTDGLVRALARYPGVELSAFVLSRHGPAMLDGLLPPGVGTVGRPLPARPLRAVWRRVAWPPVELFSGAADVVHGTNFVVPPARRAAMVVTVHDLTCVRFPELVDAASLVYPELVGRAIGRGAWVHTVSAFVADEVVEHFAIDRERVVVVPEGVPTVADADPEAGRRLAGAAVYVLALGTIEPRKDHATLLRAFDSLAGDRGDVRLVVAGAPGWGVDVFEAALERMRHRDRVVRLGYVTDADRAALLRGATVFAFPSLYEGFGLPPLEAMSAGVPVVATDAGSLAEVLGDAAALVPVGDADALAERLGRLLDDDDERDRLVRAGVARVRRYSWSAAAGGMVQLYRRAAGLG